jgi:uncharacterized Zn finger protein (UPF0148 family)
MNSIVSLSCPQCKKYTFLHKSMICVYCGHRALEPRKPKKEPAKKEAEEKEQKKLIQQKQTAIKNIRNVSRKGISEITVFLKKHKNNSFFRDHPEIHKEIMSLESIYYKKSGLEDEYFEHLQQFVPEQPFEEQHLKLKYELACTLQEKEMYKPAYKLFRQFIDNYCIDYKDDDIKARYLDCKSQMNTISKVNHHTLNGAIKIRTDIFKFRENGNHKKIDQIFNKNGYFSDTILLPYTSDHSEYIDQSCPQEITLEGVRNQLKTILDRRGLSEKNDVEIQTFKYPGDCLTNGKNKKLIVIIPKNQNSLIMETGSICPVASIEKAGTHVSLIFQLHFRPLTQDRLSNIKTGDFNTQVKQTVLELGEVDNNRVLQSHIMVLKNAVIEAIQLEIAHTSRTPIQFKL